MYLFLVGQIVDRSVSSEDDTHSSLLERAVLTNSKLAEDCSSVPPVRQSTDAGSLV